MESTNEKQASENRLWLLSQFAQMFLSFLLSLLFSSLLSALFFLRVRLSGSVSACPPALSTGSALRRVPEQGRTELGLWGSWTRGGGEEEEDLGEAQI